MVMNGHMTGQTIFIDVGADVALRGDSTAERHNLVRSDPGAKHELWRAFRPGLGDATPPAVYGMPPAGRGIQWECMSSTSRRRWRFVRIIRGFILVIINRYVPGRAQLTGSASPPVRKTPFPLTFSPYDVAHDALPPSSRRSL